MAPELAGRAKDFVIPAMVTSAGRARRTAAWPVPLAFWQSSQEQRNIDEDRTGKAHRNAAAGASGAEIDTGTGTLHSTRFAPRIASRQGRPANGGLNVSAGRVTSRVMNVPLADRTAFAPDYPIETERLRLRPFNRGDVDAVFGYRSLPEVAKYLFDEPLTHEECAEAVRARIGQIVVRERRRQDPARRRTARRRASGRRSVADLALASMAAQAEIGFILDPAMHGQGFATEAAAALLGFAFESAGIHRVYARCDARNTASAAVMQRLGHAARGAFTRACQVQGGLGRGVGLRHPRPRMGGAERRCATTGCDENIVRGQPGTAGQQVTLVNQQSTTQWRAWLMTSKPTDTTIKTRTPDPEALRKIRFRSAAHLLFAA